MTENAKLATKSRLLGFHEHRGEGWNVHTEDISITVAGEKAQLNGYVYDPSSMAGGDGQTNLGKVGFERTIHALLQEAHLTEISMSPIVESDGLRLAKAAGDERESMLLAVEPDAD